MKTMNLIKHFHSNKPQWMKVTEWCSVSDTKLIYNIRIYRACSIHDIVEVICICFDMITEYGQHYVIPDTQLTLRFLNHDLLMNLKNHKYFNARLLIYCLLAWIGIFYANRMKCIFIHPHTAGKHFTLRQNCIEPAGHVNARDRIPYYFQV